MVGGILPRGRMTTGNSYVYFILFNVSANSVA